MAISETKTTKGKLTSRGSLKNEHQLMHMCFRACRTMQSPSAAACQLIIPDRPITLVSVNGKIVIFITALY